MNEELLIIDYIPNRKRRKKEPVENKVKIALEYVERLLTIVKKAKNLPFHERVRFTEIAFA